MNQDQQGDQAVQAIADWMRHVDQDGYYGGEPGAVHALRDARDLYRSVVAPLLAERDEAVRLIAAERDDALAQLWKRFVWEQDLRRETEASRRDWAAEALRLDNALAEIAERCDDLSAKADSKIGEIAGADLAWAAWGKAAQWMRKARSQPAPASRPVCAVHQEEGR